MNTLFNFSIKAISVIMISIFLLLIFSMVSQLITDQLSSPPDIKEIFFAIKLSLFTATISAILSLIISVPIAYLFSRKNFFGKTFFDTLLDLPVVLSPIALGSMLLIFLNTPFGRQLDSTFGPFIFNVKGIILAQFFVITGLAIRLIKNSIENIDLEYENLARSLGYNKFEVFFKVVIPMAKNGLISAFLLIWARAIGEFGATITLAGATPGKTETIPIAINLSFEAANTSNVIIFISILILISFTVLFTIRKIGGYNK